jgi:hypothetical protein
LVAGIFYVIRVDATQAVELGAPMGLLIYAFSPDDVGACGEYWCVYLLYICCRYGTTYFNTENRDIVEVVFIDVLIVVSVFNCRAVSPFAISITQARKIYIM